MIVTRSFKPFVFRHSSQNELDFADEKELGLYVHIPFCRSLCSFCPYCKVVYDKDTAKRYKVALLKEIEMVGSKLKEKKEVTSLYFGGGTPALMIDSLHEIITCIKKYFTIKKGIAIELHPDDISQSNIEQLKSIGFSMVSVGIQSFHPTCLNALSREGSDFPTKMSLVKNAHFDVVDVDLIFAIPNQTIEILIEDVQKAFLYGATQISTYPFIDFTFANNTYKPLLEKEKKKMLYGITNYFKKTCRERTSVWTFAKKNTEKYSSVTRDNFLGFGVSATTLLRKTFTMNTFSINDYINRINQNLLPTSLTLHFTLRQRAAYYLFWSCYSTLIDPAMFEKLIGKPLKEMYGFEIWICEKLRLLEKRDSIYKLTDKGAYYYHVIEQAYTTAYIDKMWNVSRIIAFPNKIVLK